MIKHIVMFRFKKENKNINIKKAIEMINHLPSVIKEIKNLEVGIDINKGDAAADIVLYSEFDNEDNFKTYQLHPEHQEVLKFLRDVIYERRVVDFEK